MAQQQLQAVAIMTNLSMMGMGALGKAFYKKYGKEALPIITEVMGQGGVQEGKIMQQMAPAKSMNAVGEMYKNMGAILGMGLETAKLSDDTFHFTLSKCPFGIEGTSKELCEAMMAFDKNAVSTFLGKEVDVKVLKTVAAKDKICEVVFSKK
jgi:predicted hydrocarbon binding protein